MSSLSNLFFRVAIIYLHILENSSHSFPNELPDPELFFLHSPTCRSITGEEAQELDEAGLHTFDIVIVITTS